VFTPAIALPRAGDKSQAKYQVPPRIERKRIPDVPEKTKGFFDLIAEKTVTKEVLLIPRETLSPPVHEREVVNGDRGKEIPSLPKSPSILKNASSIAANTEHKMKLPSFKRGAVASAASRVPIIESNPFQKAEASKPSSALLKRKRIEEDIDGMNSGVEVNMKIDAEETTGVSEVEHFSADQPKQKKTRASPDVGPQKTRLVRPIPPPPQESNTSV